MCFPIKLNKKDCSYFAQPGQNLNLGSFSVSIMGKWVSLSVAFSLQSSKRHPFFENNKLISKLVRTRAACLCDVITVFRRSAQVRRSNAISMCTLDESAARRSPVSGGSASPKNWRFAWPALAMETTSSSRCIAWTALLPPPPDTRGLSDYATTTSVSKLCCCASQIFAPAKQQAVGTSRQIRAELRS